jgi:hypothetical protein
MQILRAFARRPLSAGSDSLGRAQAPALTTAWITYSFSKNTEKAG